MGNIQESLEYVDFIIVGQGLAGTVLANALQEAGQTVRIFNNAELPSSSRVAAGIFNPVTGRKLVKTWLADDIFPFLEKYYAKLENRFGQKFFHEIPIYRPFPNEEVRRFFQNEEIIREFEAFATIEFENSKYQGIVNNELGGVTTSHSGWVDLNTFLDVFKAYFSSKDMLVNQAFEIESLQLTEDNHLIYKKLKAGKLIFCEGFHGKDNPFFNWLPFNPVKGEVLEVEIEGVHLQEIINQGAFVVPLPDGRYKVGATYSWHELDWISTIQAREELTLKYGKLLKPPFKFIAQKAGVRPATKDRRPLIGLHPVFKQLGIFNGLGSKGVSLAPYFAKHFTEFLTEEKELASEVNINRFASLYLA